MRTLRLALLVTLGALSGVGHVRAAGEYPVTLAVDAQLKSGVTTVSSMLTIHVQQMMHEDDRMRVTSALKLGGYAKFLSTLRMLPAVGTIEIMNRKVDIRYAREDQGSTGRRLILVADHPLFFLNADPKKSRAGYELTVVDLRFDAQGNAAGTMAGAARVKPAPEDGVVLDRFAEAPVQLKARVVRP